MNEFKKLLKEKDITGAQLARRLKLSRGQVSYWTSGKGVPKTIYIPMIAKILNETVERVLKCFEEE